MGQFNVHFDTKRSDDRQLSSLDMLLNTLLVECIYLAALAKDKKAKMPLRRFYVDDGSAVITLLEYSNPLDISALVKSVTEIPVNWVLERSLFYSQSKDGREIENENRRQDAIKKKLENVSLLIDVRAKALAIGIEADETTKIIGQVLHDCKIDIQGARTHQAGR